MLNKVIYQVVEEDIAKNLIFSFIFLLKLGMFYVEKYIKWLK